MTDSIRYAGPSTLCSAPLRRFAPAVALAAVFAMAATTGTPAQTRAPVPPTIQGEGAPSDRATDCVPGSTAGAPCPNLTEKLDPSDGVIRPPTGIDPEIRTGAPAPNPGTTPVIRPGDLPAQPPQAPAR